MPDWLDAKTFDEAMKVMVITFDFVFGGRKLHKLIAKYQNTQLQLDLANLQAMK